MPLAPFSSGPRADKSFQIGLGFVVVFAIVEVAIASFYYVGRMRPPPTAVAPRNLLAPLPSAAPSVPPIALAVASATPALTPATSTLSVSDRLWKEATPPGEAEDTVNESER